MPNEASESKPQTFRIITRERDAQQTRVRMSELKKHDVFYMKDPDDDDHNFNNLGTRYIAQSDAYINEKTGVWTIVV